MGFEHIGSAVLEIILRVLPDNDVLRAVVIIAVLVLARFPLEWIGRAIRYMYRWVRCRFLGVHSYAVVTGARNLYGQLMSGTVRCVVCGEITHFSEF